MQRNKEVWSLRTVGNYDRNDQRDSFGDSLFTEVMKLTSIAQVSGEGRTKNKGGNAPQVHRPD